MLTTIKKNSTWATKDISFPKNDSMVLENKEGGIC